MQIGVFIEVMKTQAYSRLALKGTIIIIKFMKTGPQKMSIDCAVRMVVAGKTSMSEVFLFYRTVN